MNGNRTDLIFRRIASLVAIVLALWGLIELGEHFGFWSLKFNVLAGILMISIGFNIWMITDIRRDNFKLRFRGFRKQLPEVLLRGLEGLAKEENYEAILRYHENFSRSLWVEGKPKTRVKLGEIVEDAAAKVGDKVSQAAALIDTLGWTLVSLKQYTRAKESIDHGLRIAKEINNFYWMAKAHRHIAGIHVESRLIDKAYKELKTSREFANKIQEEKVRKEMLAGIEYGAAIIAITDNDPERAFQFAEKSEELRLVVGDKSRIVRVYSLKGQIAEMLDDLALAKDYYRQGLEMARDIGRRDEIIRNNHGLARVLEAEGEIKRASEYKKVANKLMEKTPLPYLIEEEEKELRRIQKRKL